MKTTKRNKEKLNYVFSSMIKTQKMIRKEDIFFGRKNSHGNNLSFYNKQGLAIDEINKFCGSDLQYLDSAISTLASLLNE